MLSKKEREVLKKNRLAVYDGRIFELEMDLTAAEAAGETDAVDEIQRNIEKLRKAREAVAKM